jgi:hypothetical protein
LDQGSREINGVEIEVYEYLLNVDAILVEELFQAPAQCPVQLKHYAEGLAVIQIIRFPKNFSRKLACSMGAWPPWPGLCMFAGENAGKQR